MEHGYEIWHLDSMKFVQATFTSNSIERIIYKLSLVGVQKVRWEGGGTEPAGEHTFSMESIMRIMN
jgi:hypothetical protein